MITRVLQSLRDTSWHPSDEQLVAFIDAELGPRESARVRRHIAHCWACRGRERKLAETIDAFMDAYASHAIDEEDESLLPHPARLPHAARAALRERTPAWFARFAGPAGGARLARFARVREYVKDLKERARETARAVVVRAARHPYVPPATIARVGVACATAVIIVLLSTGVPLSARQVVKHVDRAERGVLAATPAPVIYQRLDIAVRQLPGGATTRGTFDVWTDVERHRHHGVKDAKDARDGSDASDASDASDGKDGRDPKNAKDAKDAKDDDALAALLALFARHGVSSAWPVSLRSYEQMRAAATGGAVKSGVADGDAVAERVVHEQAADGERLLALETTAVEARNQSIDTRLVVRERDWHPIEQRLTVREGSATTEFVVREKGFEVIPLATLPIAFFDASRPSGSAVEEAIARADVPVETRRPAPPTVSELVSAEVQAMFALHRVGMTAEDDIAVQRHESTIDVTGLTTTAARRRQLTDAIARIKHVRVRIQTTDEALSELSGTAPAEAAPAAAATRASRDGTSAASDGRAAAASAAPPIPLRMDEAAVDATRLPVQALADQSRPADRQPDEAAMRRAREAVRQSLTLLERAWALRRLAEWSRRTNANAVTASTRELIDLMLREHADAASKALTALDTTVTPTLPAASAVASPSTTDTSDRPGATDAARAWVDVATDFFGVAAEIDRDTRRLFTASPTPTTDAADEARRLRHGLDRAARSLLELRQPHAPPQPELQR
jgi:hypothetical protein